MLNGIVWNGIVWNGIVWNGIVFDTETLTVNWIVKLFNIELFWHLTVCKKKICTYTKLN